MHIKLAGMINTSTFERWFTLAQKHTRQGGAFHNFDRSMTKIAETMKSMREHLTEREFDDAFERMLPLVRKWQKLSTLPSELQQSEFEKVFGHTKQDSTEEITGKEKIGKEQADTLVTAFDEYNLMTRENFVKRETEYNANVNFYKAGEKMHILIQEHGKQILKQFPPNITEAYELWLSYKTVWSENFTAKKRYKSPARSTSHYVRGGGITGEARLEKKKQIHAEMVRRVRNSEAIFQRKLCE
jgi:hypothetical protein